MAMNEISDGRERAKDGRDEPAPESSPGRRNGGEPDPSLSAQELEERLRKRFLLENGKYHFRSGAMEVAFEDHGSLLRTQTDEADVVRVMVQLAQARGWQSLNLSGTEAFRREAWVEATRLGLQTTGYQPRKVDLARLQELNREDARRVEARAAPAAEMEAGQVAETALSPRQRNALRAVQAVMRERGDSEEAIHRVSEKVRSGLHRDRGYYGTVIEHGAAPYANDRRNDPSYFVKLATPEGERTLWGKELEAALTQAGLSAGHRAVLRPVGRVTVEVAQAERDAAGRVVGSTRKVTYRNQWIAESLERIEPAEQSKAIARALREPKVEVFDPHAPAKEPRTLITPDRHPQRERSR